MSALLAIPMLLATVFTQTEIPNETLMKIEVLPTEWVWSIYREAPEQAAILLNLADMPTHQRERLLASTDARDRGVGIFVVAQQGDWRRLLEINDLLDDDGITLPDRKPVANARVSRSLTTEPQTVGQLLSKTYAQWFGIPVGSVEEFRDSKLSLIREPGYCVQPWIERLHWARQLGLWKPTTGEIKDQVRTNINNVKSQIAELPEEVRWAIITEAAAFGRSSGKEVDQYYGEQEARDVLRSLPPILKAEIRGATVELTFDPVLYYEGNYTERGKKLMQAAAKLLEEPSP